MHLVSRNSPADMLVRRGAGVKDADDVAKYSAIYGPLLAVRVIGFSAAMGHPEHIAAGATRKTRLATRARQQESGARHSLAPALRT